jgi:hypothetical protein
MAQAIMGIGWDRLVGSAAFRQQERARQIAVRPWRN